MKLRKQDGDNYIEIPGSKGGQLTIYGTPDYAPFNGNFGAHFYYIVYLSHNWEQPGNSQYDMCMAMIGGQFGNAYLGAMAINNPKVRAKTGGFVE
ncbi:hypothetical protein FAS33_24685 [Salmonella enterica subsp. enterica serovar Newport]|nr:hypothetical protein [Salmonella enterica subsp. enterica serovar Newport]EHE7853581.1 hypothetical protein [Salmonella enterica subsp. enterica serovar Teko]